MTAINRNAVKFWIVAAGTAPSSLSTSVWSSANTSGYIAGQIKSYKKSGGEIESDSDPVFGGFVDRDKPQTQFDLEFEIVPGIEASAFEWETLAYSLDSTSGTAVYTTKGIDLSDRAVFIQAVNGANNKSWGFNNCQVRLLDQEHNADDNQKQTFKLSFSPTDSAGIPNFQYSKQAVTSLKTWASLATS